MSRYLKRDMQADEKIVYESQIHWIIYNVGAFFTLIGALIGHYGTPTVQFLLGSEVADMLAKPISFIAVGTIIIGAMYLLIAFIRQISTELVITDRRVIAKYGFIATTTYEVMIHRVEGANIDQTVLGRILGYGTVMVKGTGGGISPIDHVANPYRFHSSLMLVLEAAHKHDHRDEPVDHGRHD